MQKILVEDKEYTCLDTSYEGMKHGAYWFTIREENHFLYGKMFGINNVTTDDGYKVDFDVLVQKEGDFQLLKPIIDDFMVVFISNAQREDNED